MPSTAVVVALGPMHYADELEPAFSWARIAAWCFDGLKSRAMPDVLAR
jgi:hypothetical protein